MRSTILPSAPPIYEMYAEMVDNGYTFVGVEVVKSRPWGQKRIVDPVFSFRHKETNVVQKYFVRVDVGHLFPMLANPIAEYFDR